MGAVPTLRVRLPLPRSRPDRLSRTGTPAYQVRAYSRPVVTYAMALVWAKAVTRLYLRSGWRRCSIRTVSRQVTAA
jgi:hypothetical protein